MTLTIGRVAKAIAIIAVASFVLSLLLYAWLTMPGGGSLTVSG